VRAALDSQGLAHIGFALEWVSVYTFQCRRMAKFRHGRVLFVGDSAHQVSPFGARGANSGVQDTDNLLWKLKLVIDGTAPASLLDSYDDERGAAADENLLNSTRSTDFMTPKSRAARVLRDAVLSLAEEVPAGRALVNSGRLSVPTVLIDSPLNTPDTASFDGWMVPGSPLDDAPVRDAKGRNAWLLPHTGHGFVLLRFGLPDAFESAAIDALAREHVAVQPLFVLPPGQHAGTGHAWVTDIDGLAAQRCDARPGSCYLIRPDQHVAARWRRFDAAAVCAALARASGRAH
jgi:3-(3-hydroxy-phenyl)propionate hydroxylase